MFTFNYSHSSNNKHHFSVTISTAKRDGQRSDGQFEYEDVQSNIISYDIDTEGYQLRDDSFPEALEETLCMQFEEYVDYWLKTA